MRKLPLLIGIPCALLWAAPASAASPLCNAVKALPAVSTHYVKRVLERADAGLTLARAEPAAANFAFYLLPWTRSGASSWVSIVDSYLRVTQQGQSLRGDTACQRFDLLLIECKMEEVRDEMNASLRRGSFIAIMRLQSLLTFLNERWKLVSLGGRNPRIVDSGWGGTYLFDDDKKVWCCPAKGDNICRQVANDAACQAIPGQSFQSVDRCTGAGCRGPDRAPEADASLCPFHSDYVEPFQNGFGCDTDVMAPRKAYPALAEELAALEAITAHLEEFRRQSALFGNVQNQVDFLLGQQPSMPVLPPARTHVTAYGCNVNLGYCALEPSEACSKNADCAELSLGECIGFPGVCSGNRLQQCEGDADCAATGAGGCRIGPPDFLPRGSLRGPFSAEKDHISILERFVTQRIFDGATRAFPDDLKLPSEFPPEKSKQRKEREGANPLEQAMRATARAISRSWSAFQGKSESALYPRASDATLGIAEDMIPLRTAVGALSRLANPRDGLRDFVLRFAYFLRVSCIGRPCNLRLEQIMKLALTDDCFPYGNGDFLSDTKDRPRWQRCAISACIRLPGMPDDTVFPDHCKGLPLIPVVSVCPNGKALYIPSKKEFVPIVAAGMATFEDRCPEGRGKLREYSALRLPDGWKLLSSPLVTMVTQNPLSCEDTLADPRVNDLLAYRNSTAFIDEAEDEALRQKFAVRPISIRCDQAFSDCRMTGCEGNNPLNFSYQGNIFVNPDNTDRTCFAGGPTAIYPIGTARHEIMHSILLCRGIGLGCRHHNAIFQDTAALWYNEALKLRTANPTYKVIFDDFFCKLPKEFWKTPPLPLPPPVVPLP